MPEGGEILLAAEQEGSKAQIRISDSGSGMNDTQIEHCMEPFFTTKGAGGTGLGLAEVFGMIQRHNGEMKITSKEDEGTTILLSFENTQKLQQSEQDTAASGNEDKSLSALKILCVDDDERILDGLKEMFAIDGHNVSTAGSGQEALYELKLMAGKRSLPDVVFTDLGMPGMDGYELAAAIKKEYRELPVVMLSGWGHQISESEKMTNDLFCVLSKPPRIRILREVLAKIKSGGE